jgi:uncharacterized membrane protein YqjE
MPAEAQLGVVRALRTLAGTLIEMVETRLAIVSSDVEETIAYLARTLFAAALAALFLFLAVMLLVLLAVAAFWDTHRLLALGIAAGAALAGALIAGWTIARGGRKHARFLAASLDELRRDRAALAESEA